MAEGISYIKLRDDFFSNYQKKLAPSIEIFINHKINFITYILMFNNINSNKLFKIYWIFDCFSWFLRFMYYFGIYV